MVTNADVPARKRPEERPSRLTIEYYGPGEDELITRLRVSAVQRKEPVRDWMLRAIRHELARLEREDELARRALAEERREHHAAEEPEEDREDVGDDPRPV